MATIFERKIDPKEACGYNYYGEEIEISSDDDSDGLKIFVANDGSDYNSITLPRTDVRELFEALGKYLNEGV